MMKMNMFKKLLLSFLASTIVFVSILPLFSPVRAQTWYNQPFKEWYVKVYDPDNPDEIFGERYTAAQVQWVIYGLAAFALNNLGDPELNVCLMDDHSSLFDVFIDCAGEIINAAADLISLNTNTKPVSLLAVVTARPISGIEYFKDVAQRLHLIPEAKAQGGFGFEVARPMLELWRFVRNTAYFLLILVMIAMAFMIMFRVRISPQTVITVQSALPKVIIALLLITFSYAIAGFLIDLMYVVMGLLAAILSSSPISEFTWSEMYEALTQRGILGLMFQYLFVFNILLLPAMFSGGIIPAFLAVTAIVPLIISVLVFIILLIATFKILWLMLKTYVMIMLYIIAGPIMILLGTIGPGGFGAWLRAMIAQLAVYPAVAMLFFIAFVFLRAAVPGTFADPLLQPVITELFAFDISNTIGGSRPWNAPFTLGDQSATEIMWMGVSLAVVLLIPRVADIIRGMLERKPFSMGTAIGEALGPAGRAAGTAVIIPVGMARGHVAKYAADRAKVFSGAVPGTTEMRHRRFWEGVERVARGRG